MCSRDVVCPWWVRIAMNDLDGQRRHWWCPGWCPASDGSRRSGTKKPALSPNIFMVGTRVGETQPYARELPCRVRGERGQDQEFHIPMPLEGAYLRRTPYVYFIILPDLGPKDTLYWFGYCIRYPWQDLVDDHRPSLILAEAWFRSAKNAPGAVVHTLPAILPQKTAKPSPMECGMMCLRRIGACRLSLRVCLLSVQWRAVRACWYGPPARMRSRIR